ncbi:hypothetical protein AMTR_s00068p00188230 [Amborella trichopoda]|uniref:Peroxin-13 n=1 Tax=Amborella trichopoda TaxID=13333 RepID=U5D4L0_AMBTC|nr:hypothetical protein AMTR_s00068p00188230 [Amborella trichopoda]
MQSSAGLSPFKPPAPGRTADVVAASGTAKPGVPVAQWNPVMNGNPAGRPQPSRAWEQNRNNCEYGANMNYNPGYGPPSPPSFWIFVLRVLLHNGNAMEEESLAAMLRRPDGKVKTFALVAASIWWQSHLEPPFPCFESLTATMIL